MDNAEKTIISNGMKYGQFPVSKLQPWLPSPLGYLLIISADNLNCYLFLNVYQQQHKFVVFKKTDGSVFFMLVYVTDLRLKTLL